MVNKNILKIRKKLDKLDNSLLEIIKKRTKLVDLVIKNKKFTHEYHWGSGISLNIIPDFFEIHFPIADSSGSIYKNNFYTKKIRLQLSLRPSTISKLFSRSWF